MRALISGASGFIGRHVAAALVDRGDEVVAISRLGRAEATHTLVGRPIEVLEDPGSTSKLVDLLADCKIDATFHLGGRLDSQPSLDEIDAVVEANVGFPSRLLAALTAAAPTSVFVNTGTVWEHGRADGSGSPSFYGATKRAFGEVLRFYGHKTDLQTRTVVLPWVYGRGQAPTSIVPLLVNALVTGESLDATSGNAELDLVHVDDVVAGLLMSVDPDVGDGRWVLSSGATVTLRDVADELSEMSRRAVPVRWGALPDRSMPGAVSAGVEPPLPGWSRTVGLTDGLRDLVVTAEASRAEQPGMNALDDGSDGEPRLRM